MHLSQQQSAITNQHTGTNQSHMIVCADCQSECPVIGRTDDDMYTICGCGRYIQIADQTKD
ncbi:MAG TPA: hypothetical protein VFV38_00960 [Ktedonobacteraceae bacterium]|nr:hypothetical protein [Ktedonobacteraceae bacterium]